MISSRDQSSDLPLRIDTVEREGSLVLALRGELDITTSHLLDEALERARDTEAVMIVVDLIAVSFIDSTGLYVLVKHTRAEGSGRRIRLTKGSSQVQRLFQLTGALEYLPFLSE